MNIADAEDAVLFAQAEVGGWMDEFLRDWYAPVGATMMAIVLSRLTPEALQAMRELNPAGMEALEAIVKNGGR